MKSIICLIAVVCAISFVSVKGGEVVKMFAENESGPSKTHQQIVAELSASELSPEQVAYLVSSFGEKGVGQVIGLWREHDLTHLNRVLFKTCTKSGLAWRSQECDELANEDDGSVLFNNLDKFCRETYEKIADYCKDKMEEEFEDFPKTAQFSS